MSVTALNNRPKACFPKKDNSEKKPICWELTQADMDQLLEAAGSDKKIETLRRGIFWRRFS